jgi:hypothetical protein
MKMLLFFVVLAVSLCSCTSKEVYNSVQANQRNECDKLQPVQRQECLTRFELDYEKYEQERKKLLEKKP